MPSKVNESKWRMVRLRPQTVVSLREFETKLRNAREKGQGRVDPNERDQMSLDSIIAELLRREHAHQMRSRQAGQRKRKTKQQEAS